MKKSWKYLYVFLIVIFSIHLIRDVMQIFGFTNFLTELWHRSHLWCKPYCNEVTIIPEIFIIVGSIIVIKRREVGKLGYAILISLIFWSFAALLS